MFSWCPEQDSNLHASRHTHLKRARLPFRHLGIAFFSRNSFLSLSGKRDSNRDPNLGKVMLYQLSYFRIVSTTVHHFPDCECKGSLFFETTKIIDYLFLKKVTNFFGFTGPIKVSAYPFSG